MVGLPVPAIARSHYRLGVVRQESWQTYLLGAKSLSYFSEAHELKMDLHFKVLFLKVYKKSKIFILGPLGGNWTALAVEL